MVTKYGNKSFENMLKQMEQNINSIFKISQLGKRLLGFNDKLHKRMDYPVFIATQYLHVFIEQIF